MVAGIKVGGLTRDQAKAQLEEKIKSFGTFILKAYNKDIVSYIVKQGGMSPKEAFLKHNKYSSEFNINQAKIPQ